MQWSSATFAGFSVNRPWLQPVVDYREVNVERQEKDPSSLLSLYRALFALRKKHEALSLGKTAMLAAPPGLLVYSRSCGSELFLVVLNFSGKTRTYTLADSYGIVLASDPAFKVAGSSLSVPAFAACVLAPSQGTKLG